MNIHLNSSQECNVIIKPKVQPQFYENHYIPSMYVFVYIPYVYNKFEILFIYALLMICLISYIFTTIPDSNKNSRYSNQWTEQKQHHQYLAAGNLYTSIYMRPNENVQVQVYTIYVIRTNDTAYTQQQVQHSTIM